MKAADQLMAEVARAREVADAGRGDWLYLRPLTRVSPPAIVCHDPGECRHAFSDVAQTSHCIREF